jgi:hypothetical protein
MGSEVSRRGFLGGAVAGVGVAAGAVAGAGALAGAAAGALTAGEVAEAAGGRPRLDNRMRSDREWADFLAGQDLIWKRTPRTWYEGPFLGNGFLAVGVYSEPGANALRFKVDHGEVQDHRPAFGNEWGVARLPVGHLTLEPVGQITGVDLRLDLWNAELRGTVTTDKGRLTIRALVQNDRGVLLATVAPTPGERGFRWVYHPADSVSPRIVREPPPANFPPNPPPSTRSEGEINVALQPLHAGGQTATAYREKVHGHERTLLLSVAHSYPDTTAEATVLTAVRRASAMPTSALLRAHREWWHAFYRKSFLSIPDGLLQSFYWIQLYKFACASREDSPVMATTGPWLEPTPWPSVWWNLNVQLEYWPAYGSNHLELDAIPRTLVENQDILVGALRPEYRDGTMMALRRSTDAQMDDAGYAGAPGVASPQPEVGNLPWALHNVWLNYRHSMDTDMLREVVFPLLRKAMNYYLRFLFTAEDGKLHLPYTFSPEYGNAPDCNFDLALIRWSCRTLLDSASILGIDDPLAPRWREVLTTLVDYPVDANGFMVGTGEPFAKSHRHYSHLLAVYPLYLVNWDQPEHRDLIERSLKHWISFEGALRGYSFTGAASISAQMGRGNDALTYLRELVARFIQPNTMYYEAGPVIETPLSGAQSIHDMLCQSWGGVIRIFPGVPDEWADVTLHDFRTEGAFLVSAVRRRGRTSFVRLKSLAGAPCRLRHGLPSGRVTVRALHGPDPAWREVGAGVIELDLGRDAEVVVYSGRCPDLTIVPVRITKPAPAWGLPALPPAGSAVPVDVGPHLNNDGITSEFYMGDGDFDGAGRTYPSAQLPQTGRLTDDGIPFLFVNGAEDTLNNVLAAGQVIAVPAGRYARLHVLGAADTGNASRALTVTYTDGSVTASLQLTAWTSGAAYGESEAIRTRQVHTRTGPQPLQAAVFHQVIEVDPARELASITMPAAATPRLHVFALTVEKPT